MNTKRILSSCLLSVLLTSSVLAQRASAQVEIIFGNNHPHRWYEQEQTRSEWQRREHEEHERREWERRRQHEEHERREWRERHHYDYR